MRLKIWIFTVMAVIAASAAHAGPIAQREVSQEDRIEQGVRSGSLTTGESAALERQQASIENRRDRALANDGRIGPREAAGLTHAQDRASHRIYWLKHNGRVVQ